MSIVGPAAFVPPAVGYVARQTNSYALGYITVAVCYFAVALSTAIAPVPTDLAETDA
jgi:fucose permease